MKLYFHHVLSNEFAAAGVPTPAKLDARCVRLSFDEMRDEGFADDGLFDQMKLFFLPLTMIEQDLSIDEARAQSLARLRSREREQLLKELSEKEDEYRRHVDSIERLRNNTRTRLTDSSETKSIADHRKQMERLLLIQDDIRTRIQAIENNLRNSDRDLTDEDTQNGEKMNRDLIKPNRGFIMYGPPGKF